MFDTKVAITKYFQQVVKTIEAIDKESMEHFTTLLLDAREKGRTIFVFGNGGSGATASHFCGDFLKGASYGFDKRFKIMCLNDNIPALLAIANDISYEDIFVEQLKNFVKKDDLVIGISGSGNSRNIIKAFEHASFIGAKTVAFCGFNGGQAKEIADLALWADINDMEMSEDIHMIFTHCIKRVVMQILEQEKMFRAKKVIVNNEKLESL